MTFWINTTRVAAAAAAMMIAAPASATTYDLVKDFSTTSSTGVFSYGTGQTGVTFTALPTYHNPCEGDARLGCWQTASPIDRVPLVAKNLTNGTINAFGTVVQPTDVLNLHPGPSTDAIVRFTAPTSSAYKVSFFFQTLDTNPTGVVLIIAKNNFIVFSSPFLGSPAVAPSTPGGMTTPFSGSLFLKAGDFIDYGVNNGGDFHDDSTGLSLTFTQVPEPASWALMIVGFGLAGASLRCRRDALAAA